MQLRVSRLVHHIEVMHLACSLQTRGDPLVPGRFVGVEIGVHEACLTRVMLDWFPKCVWHAVDPYKVYHADGYHSGDKVLRQRDWDAMFAQVCADFKRHIDSKQLVMHRKASDDAAADFADASVDLVFVDGLHTAPQVTRDVQNYWPKLRAGGIMCGHDVNHGCGVNQALEDLGRPYEVLSGYVWRYAPKLTNSEAL